METSIAKSKTEWIVAASATESSAAALRSRRNHHSDYSSADELDSDDKPKTDYTYAYSYSYNSQASPAQQCPRPNMSRYSLRSSSGSDTSPGLLHPTSADNGHSAFDSTGSFIVRHKYRAATTATGTTNAVADSVKHLHLQSSEWQSNSNSHIRNGLAVSTNSVRDWHTPAWYMDRMYGLDSDSDTELHVETRSRVTNSTDVTQSRFSSVRRDLLSRAGFLKPLYYVWLLLWSSVYWLIATVILLDTAILVRTRQIVSSGGWLQKIFLLALLLIPFWLAGCHFFSGGTNQRVLASMSNVMASSLSYVPLVGFSFTRPSDTMEMKTVPVERGWLNTDTFNGIVKQMILQIYGKPDEGKGTATDDQKLRMLITEIVRQQVLLLAKSETSSRQNATWEREPLEYLEFHKLKEEMEAVANQTIALKEEFVFVKMKVDGWQQEAHGSRENEFSELRALMIGLEEKILHLEKDHYILLSAMRNCCRNHSDYTAFIKEHIALTLNKMPATCEQESCQQYANFRSWLESVFVTKQELEQSMEKHVTEVNPSLLSDADSRLAEMVNAAATKYLDEYLRHHSIEVENVRGTEGISGEVSEFAIRALIREQLAVYDADKTGLPDYALESSGGSIISTRCSETYQIKTAQWSILGIPLWYFSNSPRVIIQPGVRPGECWAIKGSQGFIVIQLSGLVNISAFSLEHIPKSISPAGTIDSAPKDFSVWGLETEHDSGVLLGEFVYLEDGESLQLFKVKDTEIRPFRMVELRIHSNHGNVEYTCLYRFRVHGVLVQSQTSS